MRLKKGKTHKFKAKLWNWSWSSRGDGFHTNQSTNQRLLIEVNQHKLSCWWCETTQESISMKNDTVLFYDEFLWFIFSQKDLNYWLWYFVVFSLQKNVDYESFTAAFLLFISIKHQDTFFRYSLILCVLVFSLFVETSNWSTRVYQLFHSFTKYFYCK